MKTATMTGLAVAVLSLAIGVVPPGAQAESICIAELGVNGCVTTHELTTECRSGQTALACIEIDIQENVGTYRVTNSPFVHAEGYIERWAMDLPTGGTLIIPCVTLLVNDIPIQPCAPAGFRYVNTQFTIIGPQYEPDPINGYLYTEAFVTVWSADVTITSLGAKAETYPVLVPSANYEYEFEQWCSTCNDLSFGIGPGAWPHDG